MTIRERRNKKIKGILELLVKDFNIHTIERENQYMHFFYDDDIAGQLDSRDLSVSLYDNDYSNLLSTNVVEDLMNKKVASYLENSYIEVNK